MTILVFCSIEVGGQPFRMARALHRQGLDVLYVSLAPDAAGHDSTSFHYGDGSAPWDVSHLFHGNNMSASSVSRQLRRLHEDRGITACLATGRQAYLLREAGIPYHYWSYGSDLDQNCFSPGPLFGYSAYARLKIFGGYFLSMRRQFRRSIQQAAAVMISPYQKEALLRVAPGKELFFFHHLLETDDLEVLARERSRSRAQLCGALGAKHLFYSSSRHVWSDAWKKWSDYKGNDVAIRAFASYVGRSGRSDSKLVFADRGPDTGASRELIRELGVERHVVWVKERGRDEISDYYRAATACLGQFGTPVATYAALEPLAHGSVCASSYDDGGGGVPYYKELPPLLNSRDPEAIASFMERAAEDPEETRRQGRASWEWAHSQCSPERFAGVMARCLGEEEAAAAPAVPVRGRGA